MRIRALLALVAGLACRAPEAPPPDAGQAAAPLAPVDAEPEPWAVVLVAAGDVLNVRAEPRAGAEIVATLAPTARGVRGTGRRAGPNGAPWRQIETDAGLGWVNAAYLTPDVDPKRFAEDPRPRALLDALAEAVERRGSLGPLLGPRGLFVAHFAPPERFGPKAAANLLASDEARVWNGPACGEACLEGTFHAILGQAYLDALHDSDKKIGVNRWLGGGNASARLPTRLRNFPFLTVYDPGDDPEIPDWLSVTVFFEYVGGAPKIVALARNGWSP